MGKKTFHMPTDTELLQLAGAATESAARKLTAAQLLLDAGQWAEAFANAALGFEELGKAQLCFMVINIPDQFRSELTPKEFGRMFNGHEAKASFAHLILRGILDEDAPAAVTDLVAEAEAAAALTNDTKFRGLYVDLKADGSLSHPDDISEDAANWMVDRLRRLLDWIGPMFAAMSEDGEVFLAFAREFRANLDVAAIASAVESDVDTWMAQLRGAVRDNGPAPAWMEDALPALPGAAPRAAIPAQPTMAALPPAGGGD